MDYEKAYEQEHLKCADLAARVADLESKCEELEWKLNRIKKKSPLEGQQAGKGRGALGDPAEGQAEKLRRPQRSGVQAGV